MLILLTLCVLWFYIFILEKESPIGEFVLKGWEIMSGKLVFVTGGIRSGKSEFAEDITSGLGKNIVYLATAQVHDEEMSQRINLHRIRRPENWTTVEEPVNVANAISEHGYRCDAILLDCLTMLISNLMFSFVQSKGLEYQKEWQPEILQEIAVLATKAKEVKANVVIVSNEVGMTLVSDNYLGRQYQELVGKANQIIAGMADQAYLVVAGYPIDLKKGRG